MVATTFYATGLQKHHNLPNTQMQAFDPSYSICRKAFDKITFKLQVDECNLPDLCGRYSI